jgi:hypothetical protein
VEIAAMRGSSKKCFEERFNFEVTSRKVLETVERIVQSKSEIYSFLAGRFDGRQS